MAYGDFEDLTRRTAFDKILYDKAFNIAKNSKCGGYQRESPFDNGFINVLIKKHLVE